MVFPANLMLSQLLFMVISAMVVLDINSHQAGLSTLALRPEVRALFFLAKLSLLLPQSFWFLDVPVQSHSCIVSSPIETPLNVFILASAEICFVTKIWGHSHSQAEQSSGVTERTCIQAWWSLMLILCFRTLKEMTYQKPNEKHK